MAFLKAQGNPKDKGSIPELAEDLSKAIQLFLTTVKFRVINLETGLEIDEISTNGPLNIKTEADVTVDKLDTDVKVMPGTPVTTPIGGGAGTTTGQGAGSGKIKGTGTGTAKGKIVEALDLKRKPTGGGGQGGSLTVKGKGVCKAGILSAKSEVRLIQKDINDVAAG